VLVFRRKVNARIDAVPAAASEADCPVTALGWAYGRLSGLSSLFWSCGSGEAKDFVADQLYARVGVERGFVTGLRENSTESIWT
jgi:hypothetical protein